jgi:hypothetical protein
VSDPSSVSARLKRLQIAAYIALGSIVVVWLLVLIIGLILPTPLPGMAYWIAGGISLLGMVIGYGIGIYIRLKPELREALQDQKRAFADRQKVVESQMEAGTYRSPRPMLYGLGWGVGGALFAILGAVFFANLFGGLLTARATGRLDPGSDPSATIFGQPWCVGLTYVLFTFVPLAVRPIAKDGKALTGYAIGVALVWVPLFIWLL